MSRTGQTGVGVALGWALLTVGCGPSPDYKPAKEIPVAPAHDHHDHETGPHKGHIVELGQEEFHAEIVVDDKAHALRVYLLGPDGKTAATSPAGDLTVVIDATPLSLKAVAGSPEGQYSEFELIDEKVVHEIAEAGFIHGTLTCKIGEKNYSAELDVHFDGSEHKHAEEPKPAEAAAPANP